MVGSPSMWRNRRQFSRMLDWLTHILFSTSCIPLASNVCWAWLFVLGDVGVLLMQSAPREEKSLHLWVHFPTLPRRAHLSQEISNIPEMVGMPLKLPPLLPPSQTPPLTPLIQVWQRMAVPPPHSMGGCQITAGRYLSSLLLCCGGRGKTQTREGPSGAPVLGLLALPFLQLGCSLPPGMIQSLLPFLIQAGSS